MFNMFLTKRLDIDALEAIKTYPKFDYLKNKYLDFIDKTKTYYQEKDRAVTNSHPLSMLVHEMIPALSMDDIKYMNYIEVNMDAAVKQFRLTNNTNKGRIHKDIFYRENSFEVLLAVKGDVDLINIKNNWREIEPIRVTYNNETDLDLYVPFGDKKLPMPKLSVYEIDIPNLLMQYKYWAKDRTKNDKSINPNVFIATMVLPNMLDSMVDLAIFNRFRKIGNNESIPDFDNIHPFSIPDYSKGIDEILEKVFEDVYDQSVSIEQVLYSIPMIKHNNGLELLNVDLKYSTRRSEWVLWVARLEYIRYILIILGDRGIKKNRDHIRALKKYVKMLDNRSTVVEEMLEEIFYVDFEYEKEKINEYL